MSDPIIKNFKHEPGPVTEFGYIYESEKLCPECGADRLSGDPFYIAEDQSFKCRECEEFWGRFWVREEAELNKWIDRETKRFMETGSGGGFTEF